MALNSTRPLSFPSAGAFPLTVHLKVKAKTRRVADYETDSDGIDRDSLFESTPTRKRGFKRPRIPWSLVKEWPLEKYDKGCLRRNQDNYGAIFG